MFITFEGIEGSGKSTAMKGLQAWLEAKGQSTLMTREPGGSRLGQTLRAILLDMESRDLTSEAELFLYLADRAQHVQQVIAPALEAGKWVMSDRYADSMVVYQGYGRGLDPKTVHTLNDIAVRGVWPDLTLLFDLEVEQGLNRATARNIREGASVSEGRFEAESLQFHSRIREGYLTWAALHKDRFVRIDASQNTENVLEQCINAVSKKFGIAR